MLREVMEAMSQLPAETVRIWSKDRKMSSSTEQIFLEYYQQEVAKQTNINYDKDKYDEQQLPDVRLES